MALDREATAERDRMRRETARLADDARRRSAKGKPEVTRDDVENAWALLSPEGKAHTAMMAVHRAGVRPDLPWLRR
jgi:hypothetical protein